MAEQFNFGEAIVEIISDPSRLLAGFKTAEGEAQTFSARMGGIMREVAAIAIPAGVAASIIGIIHHTAESTGELRVMAQQVGLTVEELSGLQFAATKTGVEMDMLNIGLRLLSRQMVKGEDDLGKSSKALERLGISAHGADGALRPTIDVFGDIADRFSKMRDGAEKTAMAVELFGRSGSRLIPLLNAGRTGIEEFRKEAEKMGYVVSTETAERAHQFEIQLKTLQMQFTATTRTILAEILPALVTLTATIDTNTGAMERGSEPIASWTDHFLKFSVVTTEVAMTLRSMLFALEAVGKTIIFLNARGLDWHNLFKMPAQQRAEVLKGLTDIWNQYEQQVKAVGDRAADELLGPVHKAMAAMDADATERTAAAMLKTNQQLEIAIIQKRLDIAQTRDNAAAEATYAKALDDVAYYTAVSGGANATLAGILRDLSAESRKATKEAEARKQAEKDLTEAERQRAEQTKRNFAVETRHQKAMYEDAIRLGKQQYDSEKTLYDFIRDSRLRVAELTMNDYQREVAEARHAFDQQMEMLGEKEMGQEQYAAAVAQSQAELMAKLESINARYHTSELVMLQQRIAAHKSTALQIVEIEGQILDDLQRSMSTGFFDLMSGKFHDLDDVVKSFFESFKRHIADFLADLVMKELEKWLLKLALALGTKYFGGASTAGAAPVGVVGEARGGIIQAAAHGMVVRGPTMMMAGEAGVDEAVIPMPSGKVRAEVVSKKREEPFQIQQAIRVVVAPELLASMRTSPDEVVIYAASNIRSGGVLYNVIQGLRRG